MSLVPEDRGVWRGGTKPENTSIHLLTQTDRKPRPFPSPGDGTRRKREVPMSGFAPPPVSAFTKAFPAILLAAFGLLSPLPVFSQQATPCTSPEAGQFDFWVGEWEVQLSNGTVVGHNTIEKILNGCVLRESYYTPSGYAGESFNIFDASRGVWHQTWVDVGGLLLTLEGGLEDGSMVLEGVVQGDDGPVRQRITWNMIDENPDRVRQLWETSSDNGKSWSVAFDGVYVRNPGGF